MGKQNGEERTDKIKLEELLNFVREKYEEFSKAPFHSFSEFVDENGKPRRGVLNYGGVYVVYEGDDPIYVGSAGKGKHVLRYRLGDLFSDYRGKQGERKYYHTLTKKLLEGEYKRFNTLEEVQKFYIEKCRLKILQIEPIRKAVLMEAVLINLKEPKYNKETEDKTKSNAPPPL